MIYSANKYSFAHLTIAKREKNAIDKIVLIMYITIISIKKKSNLSIFYKNNLLLL